MAPPPAPSRRRTQRWGAAVLAAAITLTLTALSTSGAKYTGSTTRTGSWQAAPKFTTTTQASGPYQAAVLADNPVAYWRANDAAGSTVLADATTNKYDGTYTASVVRGQPTLLPAGGGGTSIDVDGSSAVAVADRTALNSTSAGFTIEAWVRITDPTTDTIQPVVDKTNLTQNNKQYAVFWDNRTAQGSPQALKVQWGYVGSGATVLSWSGAAARNALTAGGHLVVTFSGSTGRIYWNGTQVATGAVNGAGQANNTLPVNLGHSGTFHLFGRLDEIALYPTALSAARVAAHWAAAQP